MTEIDGLKAVISNQQDELFKFSTELRRVSVLFHEKCDEVAMYRIKSEVLQAQLEARK